MAPQSETFYGSVQIEQQAKAKSKSPLLKRVLLVVGTIAVVSFAVVALTGSKQQATRQVIDLEEVEEGSVVGGGRSFEGMDLTKGGKKDCKCALGSCPQTADTAINNEKHYCKVVDTDCIGADYGPAVGLNGGAIAEDADCTTGDSDVTAPCKAVCDYVEGEYDCWSWPCVNNGYCLDGKDSFTCVCATGFAGMTCEDDIDECAILDKYTEIGSSDDQLATSLARMTRAVCDENAECTNSKGAYSCECKPGWEGEGYKENYVQGADPRTNTDFSVAAPAWMKTGTDLRVPDDKYTCKDIDDCAIAPCMNGATCVNSIGVADGWSCECPVGPTGASLAWVGRDCSEDVDECLNGAHDCDVNSECVNTPGGFECLCNTNWQPSDGCNDDHKGRAVSAKLQCVLEASGFPALADSTLPGPAACTTRFGEGSTGLDAYNLHYQCEDGVETTAGCYDIDDCASDPCQNGGTCDGSGRPGCVLGDDTATCYVCTCAYGWSGLNCERDEDECVDSELGDRTDTVAALCRDDIAATCTNTDGGYECRCNLGWTGDGFTCIDADDCEYSPCNHGGTCVDCGTLCFVCDCVAGWRGTTCATDWNECVMGIHQCNDEATCLNNPGSYDCLCDPGWTGDGFGATFQETSEWTVAGQAYQSVIQHGCEDIDDCDPDLYDFDVQAQRTSGGAVIGDIPADAWNDGPCKFGSCENRKHGRYVCTCFNGYTDSNCDFDINECDSRTGSHDCDRHAATCTNIAPSRTDAKGWTCACNEGYSGDGVSCLDINDCSTRNPVDDTRQDSCDRGFCTDLGAKSFKCTCDDGWKDKYCDQDINECSDYTHECPRNADCTNTDGSYTCGCADGYTGDGYVECRDVDDCAQEPCSNGQCSDGGVNLYTCDCEAGWKDYNCDHDINECVTGAHNCHEFAKCLNLPGTFMCHCINGMRGDGVNECIDMDDCDPDPCDPEHGTCEDLGPNRFTCNCDDGWGCNAFKDCKNDCDECEEGTHRCDTNSDCTNNPGSYDCECRNPLEQNGGGYYNVATARQGECLPCTICQIGYRVVGTCIDSDRDCENIDECATPHPSEDNACDANARCDDTDGSYMCECNQGGPGNEWWGTGIVVEEVKGCLQCTVCYEGFHEIEPCTSTSDRICMRDIPAYVPQSGVVTDRTDDNNHVGQTTLPYDANNSPGKFVVRTEADDNMMCLSIADGDWYPSRIDYGNAGNVCGVPDGDSPADYPQLMWAFVGVGDNTLLDHNSGVSNQYLIRYNDRQGKCLFFGDFGDDIYPSLQHCKDYENINDCPWLNDRAGQPYCGFQKDGLSRRAGVMRTKEGHQAIWKVKTIKLNENKFLIQSGGEGKTDVSGNLAFECLVFEKQGASTNPSRYNWGNGDQFCGVGDWEDQGKDIALLGNKQAIFILTSV